MNYTLIAENTTKRHLRVELRACLALDNPHLYFYKEDRVATSRLHSIVVHDKRGKEVEIRRVRHGAWILGASKGTVVCISYLLHAFVMSPKETYVSGDTWIVNPKSSLMTVEGLEMVKPAITLSSSFDTLFVSQKEIQTDIEGLTLSYESSNELYHTPILGGTGIELHSIGSFKLAVKGDLDSAGMTQTCNSLKDIVDPKILEQTFTILAYIVSGHIEKRALEYGEEHGSHSSFIIIPTGDHLEKELKEKIIYSLYYHYYLSVSLKAEGMLVPWFVEGFSYWNTIQAMKSAWSKEEYRLRVERCYIRAFSLERELKETVIDSGYNEESTLSRDAGAVLCHQLSILFREKGVNWEKINDIETSSKITDVIEMRYSGDLTWLWSLSLHSSDLSGWLDVCKRYVTRDGWKIECPKRGPVKVLYS